jgi:predicted anti-sigma-YlaC factor YlaD
VGKYREIADMDCTQIRQRVLGGGDTASPEAKRHLDECPACTDLVEDNGALARFLADADMAEGDAPPSPSFQEQEQEIERLLASERRFPARISSLGSRTRWLLAGAGLLIPVAIGLARHRPDIGSFPAARLAGELGGLLVMALATCWLWLRPMHKVQPRAWTLFIILGAALLLPWIIAALPLVEGAVLTSPAPAGHGAAFRAASCFAFGSEIALPVIAIVGMLGRRGRRLPGFWLLPGIAGALAGLVGLELHCPDASPAHLLAGHAPIALVLPLVVLLLFSSGRKAASEQ